MKPQTPPVTAKPSKRPFPVLTTAMIVTLILVFGVASSGLLRDPTSTLDLFGLTPAYQPDIGQAFQFLTYAFLHFDVGHFAFNLLCIVVLGTWLERFAARPKIILLAVLSAMIAGVAHVWAYPTSPLALMGVSGVVTGFLGYALAHQTPLLAMAARVLATAILVIGAVYLITKVAGDGLPQPGDRSHVAHLAGFAFGAIWGCVDRIVVARKTA